MLKPHLIDPVVKQALREDIGARDLTSSALIASNTIVKADIEFKQAGVLCGIEIAERAFRIVDETLRFLPTAKDGEWIEKNREVAYIEGSGRSILIAERTALNFLGHLSGIATKTRDFMERVKGTKVRVLDTRKTTPNLRLFEKYAVKCGGGTNHRWGLYDEVLIKDNHLRILRKEPLVEIINKAKRTNLKKTVIGVEVKNLMELAEALKSRADYILLDNMSVETVREALVMRKQANAEHIEFEVSGGIRPDNVLEYAKTGIERISSGGLTHSVPAIDVSLDIVG
jgi:nicotinate-nucleotide pyrophosphorylase (carboxylating)